ncbi:hypothetical protein BCEP4_130063 [Burkholderia cepacia]|nr:hypothetical protein BCEP4_130063 [Burkholderia cepacia]
MSGLERHAKRKRIKRRLCRIPDRLETFVVQRHAGVEQARQRDGHVFAPVAVVDDLHCRGIRSDLHFLRHQIDGSKGRYWSEKGYGQICGREDGGEKFHVHESVNERTIRAAPRIKSLSRSVSRPAPRYETRLANGARKTTRRRE